MQAAGPSEMFSCIDGIEVFDRVSTLLEDRESDKGIALPFSEDFSCLGLHEPPCVRSSSQNRESAHPRPINEVTGSSVAIG